MVKKALVMWLFLMVLSSAAHASITGLQESIEFNEMPKETVLTVSNDYAVRQPLGIDFYVPVDYEFVSKPGWLEPHEAVDIVVRFMPRAELTGLVYDSTVIVRVGPEVNERTIAMAFNGMDSCPLEITHALQSGTDSDNAITYGITLGNPAVRAMGAELLAVEGLPAGWGYEIDYANGAVNAGGHAKRVLTLAPGGDFSGDIELKFKCGELGTVSQTIEVDHAGAGMLAGFVGFADFQVPELPAFELPELELTGEVELILDVILVLAVIALFLMFIVRYVSR